MKDKTVQSRSSTWQSNYLKKITFCQKGKSSEAPYYKVCKGTEKVGQHVCTRCSTRQESCWLRPKDHPSHPYSFDPGVIFYDCLCLAWEDSPFILSSFLDFKVCEFSNAKLFRSQIDWLGGSTSEPQQGFGVAEDLKPTLKMLNLSLGTKLLSSA